MASEHMGGHMGPREHLLPWSFFPASNGLASCWGSQEGRRKSRWYCPNRDSGAGFWVLVPIESHRWLGIGHRLMACARCVLLVQLPLWFL